MTTGGIFELVKGGKKIYIYGTHDSYPNGWPLEVVTYIISNKNKDLITLSNEILSLLRGSDYKAFIEDWKESGRYMDICSDWKCAEKEARREANLNFRFVSEKDIPKRLEKDWDYWYIVNLDDWKITVKWKKPVTCYPINPNDIDVIETYGPNAWEICDSEEITTSKENLEEYIKKYSITKNTTDTI